MNWNLVNKRFQKRKVPEAVAALLDFWAGGLSSGLTLLQVVSFSASEVPSFLKPSLISLIRKVKLGISWREALENWPPQRYCPELAMLGVVIEVNESVGSDLGGALKDLASIIRTNQKIKQDLETMTIQSRLTSLLLVSLPPILLLVADLINPDFLEPLWTTEVGRLGLWIALGLQLAGLFLVTKLTKVKWLM
ncbi:MAG: type II secretion system F family protein [Firmicutes bacterium]|nr:type II secretion system F family protein [Bacillota bacterium]